MKIPVFSFGNGLLTRNAAVLAAVLFVAAGVVSAIGLEGYSHQQHPLALLGAKPLPHATAFNLIAFVVPGALVAWLALRLRVVLARAVGGATNGWLAGIGARLLLVSALAFAAQGLLPLDPNDLDGVHSSRHAAAWMVWWIAFAAGGVLLGAGLRAAKGWRAFAAGSVCAAVLLPLLALALPALIPAGIAQRLAFALWFAWAICCGRVVGAQAQP